MKWGSFHDGLDCDGRFRAGRAGRGGGLVAHRLCEPPPGPTYEEYRVGWINGPEVNLVNNWGVPDKSQTLEGGGRVLEYSVQDANRVLCTTRFTLDPLGRISKYWFRGTKCKAPRSS